MGSRDGPADDRWCAVTGRTYEQFALDGECGQVYRAEQAGTITPRECAAMIGQMHSLRHQPLAAEQPGQDREVFLADLRWHWSEFCRITWDRGYRATRLDNGAAITESSAALLYAEIMQDYNTCPVPAGGGFLP
jgi:hypothetical protein